MPVSALLNEDKQTIVYKVKEGVCKKVSVTTGIYSGGMVEILEGLSDGEQIINHPEEYELKDGEKVGTFLLSTE